MRILVLEAASFMADSFREAIDAQDHNVTCLSGLASTSPQLVGLTSRLKQVPLTQRFDVALVDDFKDSSVPGTVIVRELTARGIPCVAISAMQEFNQEMLTAGAKLAILKPLALAAIYTNTLKLEEVTTPSKGLQLALHYIASSYRQRRGGLYDAIKELIHRHTPRRKPAHI